LKQIFQKFWNKNFGMHEIHFDFFFFQNMTFETHVLSSKTNFLKSHTHSVNKLFFWTREICLGKSYL